MVPSFGRVGALYLVDVCALVAGYALDAVLTLARCKDAAVGGLPAAARVEGGAVQDDALGGDGGDRSVEFFNVAVFIAEYVCHGNWPGVTHAIHRVLLEELVLWLA